MQYHKAAKQNFSIFGKIRSALSY